MILGLGGVVVDRSLVIPDIPGWDTVQHARNYSTQQGGMVATALAASAKLGIKSEFIGAIGDDDAGGFLVRKFIDNNVSCARIRVMENQESPCSICLVNEKTGSRTIIHYKGVQFSESLGIDINLADKKVLHLDGYWPITAIETAQKAQVEGLTVVMDPSSTLLEYPRVDELFSFVDFLIPSYAWAKAKTGLTDPEEMCKELFFEKMKAILITHGEHGCYIYDGKSYQKVPGFSVEVIDTTGAGDVFHGAFIAAQLWGLNLKESSIFANAAAALKCQKVGGQAGIPEKREVIDFLAENGYCFEGIKE